MAKKYLLAEMTWEEVAEAAANRSVVLIPVGAIEQHGPHLPVDTDNLIVSRICAEACERNPEFAVCMPIVPYGWNEHNMDFPGTISIRQEHFLEYCFDIGESIARQGFDRIIYVNSHGSNSALCDLAARQLTVYTSALGAHINWWDLALPIIDSVIEGGPRAVDHACELETSLYLHLRGELVRRDRIIDEFASDRGGPDWAYPSMVGRQVVRFMNYWSRMSTTGVNGAPSLASASKGAAIFEFTVRRLAEIAQEFRQLTDRPRVSHLSKSGGSSGVDPNPRDPSKSSVPNTSEDLH